MNTHKPDPSKPISTEGLEMIPACACNPDKGTVCMLHFDLDSYIIAEALGFTPKEES